MIDLSKLRIGRRMTGKTLRRHLKITSEQPDGEWRMGKGTEHTLLYKAPKDSIYIHRKVKLKWDQVGPDIWVRRSYDLD